MVVLRLKNLLLAMATAWIAVTASAAPQINSVQATPDPLVTGENFTVEIEGTDITRMLVIVDFRPATSTLLRLSPTQDGDTWTANGTVPANIEGDFNASIRIFAFNDARQRAIVTEPVTGGSPAVDLTPPTVAITSPSNLSLSNVSPITVEGTASENAVTVSVNGVDATLTSGIWTAEIPLSEGGNFVSAVARTEAGVVAIDSIQVLLDTQGPTVVIETPRDGVTLTSTQVDVAGLVNDIVSGTTINADDCQVFINGVEATISNRSFVVGDFLLQRGLNTLQAEAIDRAGNSTTTSIRVMVQDQAGQRLQLVQGNGQAAEIGQQLPEPLVVALLDSNGDVVPNQPVHFEVSRGDGILSAFPLEDTSVTVLTDDNGLANVLFTLGNRAGSGNHRVVATAPGFVGEVEFCATAFESLPVKIAAVMGDGQVGAIDEPLPFPFRVIVTDASGNPVGGVDVTFDVTMGGGNFGGSSSLLQTTNLDGEAFAVLTLGSDESLNANVVSVGFDGMTSDPASFSATGMAVGDAADTTVSGTVVDNQNNPLEGVTIHLEVDGAVLDPVPTAVTDAEGQFFIANAPVGALHLLVDGSTTTRPGVWAHLEFEMVTVAGQNNTLDRPIYLLPLDVANGAAVVNGGPPEEIVLQLDGIEGATLTIAPESVICPHGDPNCIVSVTQVNADRVPMAPPLGSNFMLAWTIQPPGVHFDPPAQLCIPNSDMPPGTQVEIFSFDHDVGEFVAIGTATVSEDGSQVCSDPGFGVVKGGWHGCVPPPPPPKCTKKSKKETICNTGDAPSGTLEIQNPKPDYEIGDVVTVVVQDFEDIDKSILKTTNPCDGTSTNDETDLMGGPFEYLWETEVPDGHDPVPDQTGMTYTSPPLQVEGTYKVTLTVTDMGTTPGSCESGDTNDGTRVLGTKSWSTECPIIDQSRSFGPVTVSFDGDIESDGPVDIGGESYCSYSTPAKITIQTVDVFDPKVIELPNTTVSWNQKADDPSSFRDVTLEWTGDEALGAFGIIDASITRASLQVSPDGNLSGGLDFKVTTNADKSLGGIAVLKQGVSGTFTYNYKTQNGFSGDWDFGGITNLEIELKKGNTVIARVTDTSISPMGVIDSTIQQVANASYMSNSFNIEVSMLSIDIMYNIQETTLEFEGGSGKIILSNMTGLDGTLEVSLTFMSGSGVEAKVELTGDSTISAFGMTLRDLSLTGNFNTDFDLTMMSGMVSGAHPEFDTSFDDVGFKIENGALTEFSIQNLEVEFRKFSVQISNSTFANSKLTLDAAMQITGFGSAEMEKFMIDGDGNISIEKVAGMLTQQPITGSFSATFKQTFFDGAFNVQATGGFGVAGAITVGTQDDFTFLKFALEGNTNIILGASGLKITSLKGAFGYNYFMPGNQDPLNPGTGMPQSGVHFVGLGLGLGDVANLMNIKNYIAVQFGNTVTLSLQGEVDVPATNPWFEGTYNVNQYELGSKQVMGSLGSTINIPSSGSVVSINNVNIDYAAGPTKYSVATQNPVGGNILGLVTLSNGTVNLNGNLSSPIGSMRGTLTGAASASFMGSVGAPSGFQADPNFCKSDGNPDSAGFGAGGSLDLEISGNVNVDINSSGLDGAFAVRVVGDGTLGWYIPFQDCPSTETISTDSNLMASKSGSNLRVSGDVTLSDSAGNSFTFSASFSL